VAKEIKLEEVAKLLREYGPEIKKALRTSEWLNRIENESEEFPLVSSDDGENNGNHNRAGIIATVAGCDSRLDPILLPMEFLETEQEFLRNSNG